jgi:hypothetical protein
MNGLHAEPFNAVWTWAQVKGVETGAGPGKNDLICGEHGASQSEVTQQPAGNPHSPAEAACWAERHWLKSSAGLRYSYIISSTAAQHHFVLSASRLGTGQSCAKPVCINSIMATSGNHTLLIGNTIMTNLLRRAIQSEKA